MYTYHECPQWTCFILYITCWTAEGYQRVHTGRSIAPRGSSKLYHWTIDLVTCLGILKLGSWQSRFTCLTGGELFEYVCGHKLISVIPTCGIGAYFARFQSCIVLEQKFWQTTRWMMSAPYGHEVALWKEVWTPFQQYCALSSDRYLNNAWVRQWNIKIRTFCLSCRGYWLSFVATCCHSTTLIIAQILLIL